jgi:hypothetical protein
VVDCTSLNHFEDDSTQNQAKIWCYFEAIFEGWDEKLCLSKPRTTEGPRTREARTREGILYSMGNMLVDIGQTTLRT